MNFTTFFSLSFQIILNLFFQILIIFLFKKEKMELNNKIYLESGFDNSIMFLVSIFQYLTSTISFSIT